MKDFFKKIVSSINLNSKRTKIILVLALVLVLLFFVGRFFYNKYNISDYSEITTLVNNREYILAEQKLEAFLKDDAQDPYFLVLVARTYIGRSGQVSDSVVKKDYLNKSLYVLNLAESINPNIAEIYSMKGLTYLYLGEYGFSLTYYKKALSLNPDSQNALVDIGNLYLTSGNIAGGFEIFGQILKNDPKNENAQIGLIRLFMLQYKYDQVISNAFELFGTTQNENTKLQLAEIMGSAYLKVNKYTEAKRFFDYILSKNPESGFATYGLAEVSFASSFDLKNIEGTTLEAKTLALKSVSLDSSYPYNYILLARIAHLNKNEADYNKYLELAKATVATYNFLSPSQKTDLLNTVPKFGSVNTSVKIKQMVITSTTTPQQAMIIRKK